MNELIAALERQAQAIESLVEINQQLLAELVEQHDDAEDEPTYMDGSPIRA